MKSINLYVVATPIGNMEDITIRAKNVLNECSLVITENQNTTKTLLKLLNINFKSKKFITFADFNNKEKVYTVLNLLKENENTALVSEAGTPSISDPGYKLISYIKENNENINIVTIPGASSLTAHLSISGLPTDKFMFIGFLPKKKNKANKMIEDFYDINAKIKTTFIILESKYRIIKTLELIKQKYPTSVVSIGKELTKMYEQVYYGNIEKVLKEFNNTDIKGEYIIHLKI